MFFVGCMYVVMVMESGVGKKRVVIIPKPLAEFLGLREGQKIRIMVIDNKTVIKPVRDTVWLALHGKKIGTISPEEVEEESMREQEKLS